MNSPSFDAVPQTESLPSARGGENLCTSAIGVPGSLCIAALLAISVFEIASRYLFDAPTFWATEISTYIGVAAVFLALGYSELRQEHVRVEAFVAHLSPAKRLLVAQLGNWLGVLFVALATVEMARYLASDFIAGTRNWGLLSTLLWIPQVPVLLGLMFFVLVLSGRACANSPHRSISVASLMLSIGLSYALGKEGLTINDSVIPWCLIVLSLSVSALALLNQGWRFAAGLFLLILACCSSFVLASSFGQSASATAVFIVLFLFLAMGMNVAIALGLAGALGLIFLPPVPQTVVIAERVWNGVNSFTYTAVPMFILMGSLLMRAGISRSLFDGLVVWMGRIPGGLAQATLTASGLFAALSGSSIATAATIGKAAGTEMLERGYKPSLALGSISGGGTLGILIPPSVPMIIFAAMVGVSVTKLFVAGIIPGLLVLMSMMAVVLVWALIKPQHALRGKAYSWTEKGVAFLRFGPFLGLIVTVITSLYFGVVTATEAGALGAVLALFLSAIYGKLSWNMLSAALQETAALTGGILFIVVGAGMLSWLVDYLQIASAMVESVTSSEMPIYLVLLLLMFVYLILGMFIDPISMMLMTVTITYPIVVHAGYDALWFGVALMMMIEVGLITPPVGIILFVLRGLFPSTSFTEISVGSLFFVGVILANVILIAVFPQIVTWLPSLMN